mgnify:CR=1 FL=1
MPLIEKAELVNFLKANIDVFTWNTYDVPGVDLMLACHWLNVDPETVPRKQPPQQSSKDHAEAVRIEVNKLK